MTTRTYELKAIRNGIELHDLCPVEAITTDEHDRADGAVYIDRRPGERKR